MTKASPLQFGSPSHSPLPRDVRRAIDFMRGSAGERISLSDIAGYCGAPARTLNKHFRAFLGRSPMQYLQQLRLAAARETLLSGAARLTVTEVAKRYRFNHFGRFAAFYRRSFGEPPSVTLRNARASIRAATVREAQHAHEVAIYSRDRPSIAVLPCETPASEPELAWIAESLADTLTAALSSIRTFAVTASKSQRFAARDPQRAARELNARYVLTGRLVPAGTQLRVVLRLFEASTGNHLWGESFDGRRERPLDLQDRLAAALFAAIPQRIRGAEIDRAHRAPPQNLDSYGLAMRALPFIFASRPDATRRALDLLHRAMEIDPDYSLVAALAAWGHGQLVMYNGTPAPAEERQHALRLVQRAALLDDRDPLGLTAQCAVHTMAGDFETAEALVARSLAIDPSSGWSWGRSAWLNAYKGASETAIEHFNKAIRLDPNTASRANNFTGIGAAHFNAGRYDAAASWLQRALIAEPGAAWPNRSLSVSYARMGDRPKALKSLDALRRFSPDLTVSRVVTAVPFRPQFLERLGNGLSDLGLPA